MPLIEQELCMLACWVEDPNGDYFKKHLARIPDFIWVGEDGIKMQVRKQIQSLIPQNVVEKLGPICLPFLKIVLFFVLKNKENIENTENTFGFLLLFGLFFYVLKNTRNTKFG